MVLDIYASILKPTDGGEVMVVVSAFPAEPGEGVGTFPNRTGKAKDPEEARGLAEHLAAALRSELERFGHQVRGVNLRS